MFEWEKENEQVMVAMGNGNNSVSKIKQIKSWIENNCYGMKTMSGLRYVLVNSLFVLRRN